MEHPVSTVSGIPTTGFLRLPQIIGDKRKGVVPIYPVSKSTWWAGVKEGRFPQPVKLSPRCSAWRAEDIMQLIQKTEDRRVLQ